MSRIIDNEFRNIIALSDVHGDMHNLIIQLRDCAGVITNKISDDVLTLNRMLEVDISTDESKYDETLGFVWTKKTNTYIVICGDIIDAYRPHNNNCMRTATHHCNEYPQIEIKILKFINAINKMANEYNSRIIKILGNHELMNILDSDFVGSDSDSEPDIEGSYLFPNDIRLGSRYYMGIERKDIFKIGNIGFRLLFEDNCYILFQINNNIFVHASVTNNFDYYERINRFINDSSNHNIAMIGQWKKILETELIENEESSVWNRITSDRSYSLRLAQDDKKYCEEIRRKIGNNRLIVGHTPRFIQEITRANTYSNIIYSNDKITIFGVGNHIGDTYYKGIVDKTNTGKVFGITMECENDPNDFRIFHIDTGSSRAFDNNYIEGRYIIADANDEKEKLYARTPQILRIGINSAMEEIVTIVKSNMKNTRLNSIRPMYEEYIERQDIEELKIDGDYYHSKYYKLLNNMLKHKINKYLKKFDNMIY